MKTTLLILALSLPSVTLVFAQNSNLEPAAKDSSVVVVDDIQFETEQFHIDSATNTATATLLLTSLKENPRELKINIYGTQLVDDDRNAYYFSTMALGRVLMRFEDKQNYLHYLLQPDAPVKLVVTAENISSTAAFIQVVKIVFEDSTESGRFLDAYLSN
ncbi:hypothetical protein [Parapedobacter tibetensis]|uniref:hypothetical protein n=1 Tax=Parapedobacter tibetensis TaxID=2972951 RepID=UPI00214DF0D1|nr:hypothetical protein [Parapedobacter tibetensis]